MVPKGSMLFWWLMARKPSKNKGKIPLNEEDTTLWKHVSRDVKKLDSNRFTGFEELVQKKTNPKAMTSSGEKPGRKKAVSLKPTPQEPPSNPRDENRYFRENMTPSVRQTVPGLDRNTSEKLRKGRMIIEGRVDLHGMNRREAHSRLKSFLGSAHRQGKRCVLVITGKGSTSDKTDDAPFMGGGRKGILKEEVPKWLAEPDLRRLVLDYRTAQIKHGGSGALYVLLKRTRR